MIHAEEALDIARAQATELISSGDPLFGLWTKGKWGDPVIVHDVFGNPSYWLVPLHVDAYVVGFVRVSAAGKMLAAGTFCRDPQKLITCPKVVTGLSLEEAQDMLLKDIKLAPGENAGAPLFVHDGPEGREAWSVTTMLDGKPHRWVFITPGGTYQRSAGMILDQDLEA